MNESKSSNKCKSIRQRGSRKLFLSRTFASDKGRRGGRVKRTKNLLEVL